ncbi:MAG: hypothetical protein WDA16_01725 [Candidatus Thermoplasmatota archaeon]
MPRVLFALLVGLALLSPFTSASPSRFTFDGRVGTSLVLVQDQTRFELVLHEGDVLDAALSWANPSNRLSLSIERPCDASNAACGASSALTPTQCDAYGSGPVLGTSRSLHFVAPDDGEYVLVVAGVVTATRSPFHLTVDADADALMGLRGPFGESGIHGGRSLCAA